MANPNTANAAAIRKQQRLLARRRQRWLDHYKTVLGTPSGRFVLADLIQASGAEKSPWSASGSEIHRNIGRQEIGRMVIETLKEADEDAYVLMTREVRALAIRDAHEDQAQSDPDTRNTSAQPGVAEMETTNDDPSSGSGRTG